MDIVDIESPNERSSSLTSTTLSKKQPLHPCRKVNEGLIPADKCMYSNPLSPLELKFENLFLTRTEGHCKNKVQKQILKDLSGTFESQDLTAIFGPSGSGKSSLLNSLFGYKQRNLSGSIYVNGTLRDLHQFRKISCYIMQDDCMLPYLTVEEAMKVSTDLKLSRGVPKKTRIGIINDILTMLGLESSRNTYTRNLSGGQRKRLAIAQELVNNPPIMFLDEPTSGLDSSTSFQVISLLKVLAHDGRAIICSIHQPSAKIFELFDHVYVLAEGECIYRGNSRALVHFFAANELPCPRYHNPADFVIEVAAGLYGDVHKQLVEAVKDGQSENFSKKYPKMLSYCPTINTLSTNKNNSKNFGFPHQIAGTRNQCEFFDVSSFKQFRILFWRMTLSTIRDPQLTHMRFISHVTVAVILGLLYLDIGNKSERVLNNVGFLFFSILFIMFAALMPVLLQIPLEMPIFVRENLNLWYSINSYFVARTASDIPFQFFYPTIYCSIVYFMTGQPQEAERFFTFLLVFIVLALVSQAFGLLVGALSPTVEFATFTGPAVMIPLTLFSGFFVRFDSIPLYMKWLSVLSYQKYGFQATLASVYGKNRSFLECSDATGTQCGFKDPVFILGQMDITDTSPWTSVILLIGFFLGLRLCCYAVFRIRVHLAT